MSLKDLTDQLFAEIGSFDIDHDINIFAFIGFNPEKMATILSSIEPNKSTLMKDIITLLVFSTIRGTNFAAAIKKMDPEGAKLLNSLAGKYKLKTTAKEAGNPDAITLTRLSSCFPGIIFKIRQRMGAKCPVVGDLPEKMPREFAFPSAPALIPKSDQTRYEIWLLWAKSFGATIGSENDPDKYGQIAWNSPVVTDAQRAGHMKSWGG
jgi:hypothetical protein